jgi:Secretion system C-terminal sorting domain
MKYIFTLLFALANVFMASAQWSNTSNLFYDSLHSPVCYTTDEQVHAIIVQSFPDSGYFVIWEDARNTATNKRDIYAQKYDKAGNMLWALNGLPIVNSSNDQHFTWSSNQDYRNRKTAATDSAGGFYIAYIDDSIATYDWSRICVQHIRPDGSQVFPGAGFIIAQTPSGQPYNYSQPQLIGDDAGGFYVSYIKNSDNDYVYVYGYKDNNGSVTLNGGGLVNQNGVQKTQDEPCPGSTRSYIVYPGTTVFDYNIWSDLQGGCNVIMHINGNDGAQGRILCFNRVWKAKKNSIVTDSTLFATGDPTTNSFNYQKGDLDVMYKLKILNLDGSCTSSTDHYFWDNELLISNGYLSLDENAYEYAFPKGVTVKTAGNINIDLMASLRRTINGNSVSLSTVYSYSNAAEVFDSIPYQASSNGNPYLGYNSVAPAQMNMLNNFSDTLLAPGGNHSDFSLAGGGSELYSAGLMVEQGQPTRSARLQHLHVSQETASSFAIHFTTSSNKGDLIGKELNSASNGADMQFDFPLVTANQTGNALFYVREYGRYARVSPIGNGAELAWGAMGKPIGTPVFNGSYYYPELPYAVLDAVNGTGLIGWQDIRVIGTYMGTNIFMRHLDSMNVVNYIPLNKKIQPLANGTTVANAAVLTGISKKFTAIEAYNTFSGTTSPVTEILDNYNLGGVTVNVFENAGAIRSYNGKAYLDRNYTIKPENNPAGAADINVRLFFTTAQFDALKAADATITTPADLGVIKQANPGAVVPDAYAPVAGEQTIHQLGWKAIDGGYYIEIQINSFSNFFIQQVDAALPVTWLDVNAKWLNEGKVSVSWMVADEINAEDYIVQISSDGNSFSNVCTTNAAGLSAYHCDVAALNSKKYYFRVLQRDLDGHSSLSKTVVLSPTGNATGLTLSPNPANGYTVVHAQNTGASMYSLSVISMEGKTVLSVNAITGNSYTIPLLSLRTGIYGVRIVLSDGSSITKKLIKQ